MQESAIAISPLLLLLLFICRKSFFGPELNMWRQRIRVVNEGGKEKTPMALYHQISPWYHTNRQENESLLALQRTGKHLLSWSIFC